MIVLIDLDGTLTNTADEAFKAMKDGLEDTVLEKIQPFEGARQFVSELISRGHRPLIISDSHPKYVNIIAKEIFGIPALALADKPNSIKTESFLNTLNIDITKRDDFLVVGDTWLDMELGRAFGFRTLLTQFYIANKVSEKDGIGKTWNHLKSGPTYTAKQYSQILEIVGNPSAHLWVAEALVQGVHSKHAIRLNDTKSNGFYTIFRSLGRQEVGECDRFGIASYYTEFQRVGRSQETLKKLAEAVEVYLKSVFESGAGMRWDYFTYISDKITTVPPDKMKTFFGLIDIGTEKASLFKWNDTVDGSIRNRPNYAERRSFIAQNLKLLDVKDLQGKSVIVLDDQFTTGGTAYEVLNMLRQKGAGNVLFITLFFMLSNVMSNKVCPKCAKPMQIKIRKIDGNKFYSCTPPQFRGTGCGHAENYN